jgi:transcriptional regulator NrdR family protein
MLCPVCKRDTKVTDTRPQPDGSTLRRRVCDEGHKTKTWESLLPPGYRQKDEARRRERYRRIKEQEPERHKAKALRANTRRAARAEAVARGVPPEVVYKEWECE